MITWLSGFLLNPLLAAGALGVASPILIHILSRRRFRRVRWAAMDFLLDAQRRNRRRVKIEQLILLALRCLVVMLIALMVARPFMSQGSIAAMLGVGPRCERVILLDDSFSMSARLGAGQSPFHLATTTVTKLIEVFNAEAPADAVSVFLTSNPSQPLMAASRIDGEAARRITDAVDGATPSHREAAFESAISALADNLAATPTHANTTLYIVSDFQKVDWTAAGSTDRPSPLAAPFKRLSERAKALKIVLIDLSAPSAVNLAITGLRALQPQIVAGVPARFEASVTNYSANPMSDVELSLSLADQIIPPVRLGKLSPGETIREPVEVTFPSEGSSVLRTEIAGPAAAEDALALDNARAIALDILSSVHVLLVDGEPSGDSFRDEVYLLKTALRPAGRAASGNDVTVITETDLDGMDLAAFHVVVLANVARLNPAGLKNLDAFSRDGGGVIVMAGKQIDIPWYNENMHRAGSGILPAALGEIVEMRTDGDLMHIAEWDANHPVFRAFVDPLGAVLRQVHVDSFVAVKQIDQKSSAVDQPTTSQATSDPIAPRVLARLSDPDQSPFIVEGRQGRGISLFVATSADQEWNDWASNFSFVPIMLELVQYAARPAGNTLDAVVGRPLICPVDPLQFRDTATVRGPSYPLVAEQIVIARPLNDGTMAFSYEDTDKVGVYECNLTTPSGQTAIRRGCVNTDPRESDLAAASPALLEAALPDLPFTYVRDVESLIDDGRSSRTELWWPLLITAVMLLMAEQTLAWWFGARG